MTFNIFNITKLRIPALSIMIVMPAAFIITALYITTIGIMTFSIMILCIVTVIKMALHTLLLF